MFQSNIFLFLITLVVLASSLYFIVPGNQFDRISYFILPLLLFVFSLVYEILFVNKLFFRILIIVTMFFLLILYHPGIIF